EDTHVGAGKGHGKLAERAPGSHAGMVSVVAKNGGENCACAFFDSGHSTIKKHTMSGCGNNPPEVPPKGYATVERNSACVDLIEPGGAPASAFGPSHTMGPAARPLALTEERARTPS